MEYAVITKDDMINVPIRRLIKRKLVKKIDGCFRIFAWVAQCEDKNKQDDA